MAKLKEVVKGVIGKFKEFLKDDKKGKKDKKNKKTDDDEEEEELSRKKRLVHYNVRDIIEQKYTII